MNLIIWLVVGGLIGWLASVVMNTDARQGIIENIIVGIAGAFIGGLFIGRLIGVGTINQQNFSLPSLLLSLLGAVILLAIFKLLRHQFAR